MVHARLKDNEDTDFLICRGLVAHTSRTPHSIRSVLPRIMTQLGVMRLAVIGNVASLSDKVEVADLFLPLDHVNLSAANPNHGPNVDAWGKRFYDCSNVYDMNMTMTYHKIAKKLLKGKRNVHKSNIVFTGHSKPFAALAEKRFGESFGLVKSQCDAVSNVGYGEVMEVRHMDFETTLKVCYIGLVTHKTVEDVSDYQVEDYDHERLSEGIRDLRSAFKEFVTTPAAR